MIARTLRHRISVAFILIFLGIYSLSAQHIFVEAESFSGKGGWVVDQQSVDQMGSPYLMANGLGVPVENAKTQVLIPSTGKYRVWVRTRNWVAPWNAGEAPGKFRLIVNSTPVKTVFGTVGAEWHWQDGGIIRLKKGETEIALQDLTGFNGRCDAMLLSRDLDFTPPEEPAALARFRRIQTGISDHPEVAGNYDLVVVGGGIAGICTAISAARLGCKVALIQNRPVLGGNNSSEVRVGLSGLIFQEPYPNLGKLVDEIGSAGHWTLWEAKQDQEA